MIAPWMLERHAEARELKVRKPKVPEGGSEVTVGESLDELTSRAEEVNTSKALKMSTTLNRKDGALPWLMLTGMPSVRRYTKASKEKIGKKCMTPTR